MGAMGAMGEMAADKRRNIVSSVLGVPAAPAEQAEQHFGRKLEYETDPSDVWQDLQRGLTDFVLIDTRSRGAFRAGHIPGAVSLPAGAIDASTISSLPPGSVAITYCWGPGCNGSTRGARRLAALGLRVKEMIGGYEYWVREGLPVETSDGLRRTDVDPLTGLTGRPDRAP